MKGGGFRAAPFFWVGEGRMADAGAREGSS